MSASSIRQTLPRTPCSAPVVRPGGVRSGPVVLEDTAYPLGGEPVVEGQVGAEVPDHRPQGVGVAASHR